MRTVFIALPQGRRYESPEMRIASAPRADRMLVELALDESRRRLRHAARPGLHAGRHDPRARRRPPRRRGGDVGTAPIRGANRTRPRGCPPRISGLVTGLVTAQNKDGSWPRIPSKGARPRDSPTHRATCWQRRGWSWASPRPRRWHSAPTRRDLTDRLNTSSRRWHGSRPAGDHSRRGMPCAGLRPGAVRVGQRAHPRSREAVRPIVGLPGDDAGSARSSGAR